MEGGEEGDRIEKEGRGGVREEEEGWWKRKEEEEEWEAGE